MYVGMATTLAITMRFHDKNAFPETLSVNEKEARKRVIKNNFLFFFFSKFIII
jgi:hypothetical protein